MSDRTTCTKEEIRKKIIEQYAAYRKSKGLTQKDLADVMGTQRPNVSRFESGNYNPTLDMMIKFADSMDLDIEVTLVERKKK